MTGQSLTDAFLDNVENELDDLLDEQMAVREVCDLEDFFGYRLPNTRLSVCESMEKTLKQMDVALKALQVHLTVKRVFGR